MLLLMMLSLTATHSQAQGRAYQYPVAESHNITGKSVRLSVYYESLCPDSRRFVVEELLPAWRLLGDNITVSLFPFGKAKIHSSTDAPGGVTFTCQHGPQECAANKVQACVLHLFPEPRDHLPAIGCLMESGFQKQNAQKTANCLKSLGTGAMRKVKLCTKGEQGSQLLRILGMATLALEPKLSFVPWILLDDEYSAPAAEAAQHDLLSLLVSYSPTLAAQSGYRKRHTRPRA